MQKKKTKWDRFYQVIDTENVCRLYADRLIDVYLCVAR